MGWLDDAAKWVSDRKKEADDFTSAVSKATEATVKTAMEPILQVEKQGREWTAELEDIVLKYGNTPYEQLPQLIKDKIKELNISKEQLSIVTQEIITGLKIPGIPEIPAPGDLLGAVKQILSIVTKLGYVVTNWKNYTTNIFTNLNDYLKEMNKYGGRT